MNSTKSLLLACTALATISMVAPATAGDSQQPFSVAQVVAQTPPPDVKITPEQREKLKKLHDEREKHKGPPPAAKPAAPPPAAQRAPSAPPKPAAQAKPAAPPPAEQGKPAAPSPAGAQAKPTAPPPTATQSKPAAPPSSQDSKRDNKDGRPRRDADRKPDAKPAPGASPAAPAAAQKPSSSAPAPSTAQKPAAPAPTSAQKSPAPKAATSQPAGPSPTTAGAPQDAAPPPPTKTQSVKQFIQRKDEKPTGGLEALRKERRTTTSGNRTVIREGNRTIVREGNRSTIHHNEADRFAVGARDVKVDRRGGQTISVVVRPNGISIVTTTDRDGHLLRRVRRDRHGRDIVIIDNSFAGARRGNYFVDVPPPHYREPRDRYIVDARRANRDRIYGILLAPPIDRLESRYTLEQVRYSEPLRQYMPRIDLDINFASGSWQLSPSQIDELSVIAAGINRAIDKNPREVFLIEGHTDAVGSNEDNLSLSDRRAEAVAVALTEEFQVPPENLVTQGYGEEYLKVDTDGSSRENRRVAVRRITPLIDQTAKR